ncbi:hypothetical protein GJ744_001859 [Endocarpon pusillum]|uniref:Uncharacterized protein n=1 Tax=Endocarpon pusillum TaxID=364733 RepID=A0A8H7EA27_9EURO|nr:hypothetical protein GJ744_001859 [Endocarpon pusillum]
MFEGCISHGQDAASDSKLGPPSRHPQKKKDEKARLREQPERTQEHTSGSG